MRSVATAIFFVDSAFQEANSDRAIATTGYDSPVTGESQSGDAAFATGHDTGFGLAQLRQWQDINRVISASDGHAASGCIQCDSA